MGEHILREVFESLGSDLSLDARVDEGPAGKFEVLQGSVYKIRFCDANNGWDSLTYRDAIISMSFSNKHSEGSGVIDVSYSIPVPCINVVKCALSKIDNPIARAISGRTLDVMEVTGAIFSDRTDSADAVRELIKEHVLGLFT